jgi:hypothetical protein
MPLMVDVTDPGVEVTISWPLDPGFEVLSFEIYAFYDVVNPTANDFQLVTTVGSGVSSYVDTHGYSINAGYSIIAIGVNGERSYTAGTVVTLGESPAPPQVGPFIRMMGAGVNFLELVSPNAQGDLSVLVGVELPVWEQGVSAEASLAWSYDFIYSVAATVSSPGVQFSNSDGTGQQSISILSLTAELVVPISVRQELGGATQRVWIGGQTFVGSDLLAALFPMIGSAYDANQLAIYPPPAGYEFGGLVLDCNSFDGGATVLALLIISKLGDVNKIRMVEYDTNTLAFTTLYTADFPEVQPNNGSFVKSPTTGRYVAACSDRVLTSDDGIAWTANVAPWFGSATAKPRITVGEVGGTEYYAVCFGDLGTYYYSVDGIAWTAVVYDPVPATVLNGCVIQGGFLALVGYDLGTSESRVVQANTIDTPVLKSADFLLGPMWTVAQQVPET